MYKSMSSNGVVGFEDLINDVFIEDCVVHEFETFFERAVEFIFAV